MASFFVTRDADGAPAVHDRGRCPPACFPQGHQAEYLGEFVEGRQALAVARLCYRHARPCVHNEAPLAPRMPAPPRYAPALIPLQP